MQHHVCEWINNSLISEISGLTEYSQIFCYMQINYKFGVMLPIWLCFIVSMWENIFVRKRARWGQAVEKAIKTSERVNEMKFDHSHILTRRRVFIYLFISVSLKISQLPENVVVNGTWIQWWQQCYLKSTPQQPTVVYEELRCLGIGWWQKRHLLKCQKEAKLCTPFDSLGTFLCWITSSSFCTEKCDFFSLLFLKAIVWIVRLGYICTQFLCFASQGPI